MQAISSFIFKIFILLFLFCIFSGRLKRVNSKTKTINILRVIGKSKTKRLLHATGLFSNKFFIVLNWDDVNIERNRHTVNSQLRSLRIFH